MSYVETAWSHASIPAELANVRPLGDFVLVRVLPEEEMHRNLIWLPQFSGAHADRQMRPVQPSIGEVVAAGPGDRIIKCERCLDGQDLCGLSCIECRYLIESGQRHEIHVAPGDRIMYWRVPANEVIINDQTFQFLHEEQHVLGVIEE